MWGREIHKPRGTGIISLGKTMYSIWTMSGCQIRGDNSPYRRKGHISISWASYYLLTLKISEVPIFVLISRKYQFDYFKQYPPSNLKSIQKLCRSIGRICQIVVVVIVWYLELQLPMQHSVCHKKCLCVSLNPTHGE